MNPKIVIAFISGAVLASGIVFFAVREDFEPKPALRPVAVSKPAPPKTAPPVVIKPVVAVTPRPPVPVVPKAPAPVKERKERLSPTPIHEKPSPLAPRSRQGEEALVAINQPPPVREQPEGPPPDNAPPVEAQIPPSTRDPAPAPQAPAPPVNLAITRSDPDPNAPPTVTIAAGTILPVRIGETITAGHYMTGDIFLATLDRQLVVDGWIIAQRGSRLEGRIVQATNGSNGSHLEIELVKLSLDDRQRIPIHTEPFKKDAARSTGNDVAKVAAGTAIGTAIGAAAGGGKGAAIGAGIGAVAGVAGVAMSRPKPAEIPVETRINFRIADPVTVTERLN